LENEMQLIRNLVEITRLMCGKVLRAVRLTWLAGKVAPITIGDDLEVLMAAQFLGTHEEEQEQEIEENDQDSILNQKMNYHQQQLLVDKANEILKEAKPEVVVYNSPCHVIAKYERAGVELFVNDKDLAERIGLPIEKYRKVVMDPK